MTIQELTKIIIETIDETEEDIQHYAELAQKIASVTIQVMQAFANGKTARTCPEQREPIVW